LKRTFGVSVPGQRVYDIYMFFAENDPDCC
jgi:hypothetical protein